MWFTGPGLSDISPAFIKIPAATKKLTCLTCDAHPVYCYDNISLFVNVRCVIVYWLFIQLVENNVPLASVESGMYFWTHTKWESEASHSKRNSRQAEEITRVAEFFCQEGEIHPSKITVLYSYRGQASV